MASKASERAETGTYQDLADHYGCVVLPTRIIKPRDKAKVSYCTLFG